MSLPTDLPSQHQYIEDCTIYFKKFHYILSHQNNEILAKDVLNYIDVSKFMNVDIFNFSITEFMHDETMAQFFTGWERLRIEFERVEEVDFDKKIDAPVSPKKKYEILTLVKEVVNLCQSTNCDLLVDFGSGLGYIDQLIYDVAKYKILGLECNASHYYTAKKRQEEYHKKSITNVRYKRYTVTENSDITIKQYLQEEFPNHGPFCMIGLHTCADLTAEALYTFLKMEDAKALAILPCCYHRLTKDGANLKYFPMSNYVKEILLKHDASALASSVSFMRLAVQNHHDIMNMDEKVFSLLVRAVLESYAQNHGYFLRRNKRRPVKVTAVLDFERYLQEAVQSYSLIPQSGSDETQSETKGTGSENENKSEINMTRPQAVESRTVAEETRSEADKTRTDAEVTLHTAKVIGPQVEVVKPKITSPLTEEKELQEPRTEAEEKQFDADITQSQTKESRMLAEETRPQAERTGLQAEMVRPQHEETRSEADEKRKPDQTRKDPIRPYEIINGFNLDELRHLWWLIRQGTMIKKAALYVIMQYYMQPLVERYILLDHLLFLREKGVYNCWLKKIFNKDTSPRCMALIAIKD